MNARMRKKWAARATLGFSLYFLLTHAKQSFYALGLAEARHHLRRVAKDRKDGLGLSRKRARMVARHYVGVSQ